VSLFSSLFVLLSVVVLVGLAVGGGPRVLGLLAGPGPRFSWRASLSGAAWLAWWFLRPVLLVAAALALGWLVGWGLALL
jgi:hypothetical protein